MALAAIVLIINMAFLAEVAVKGDIQYNYWF